MHSLVRRYLKTAIFFLAVGLVLGLWMLVRREIFSQGNGAYLLSAHTHAILVGFVMMMIMGVALWMFPRPEKGNEQYSPRTAGAAYWMVTAGTALRLAGELARAGGAEGGLIRWVVSLAGAAQVAGIVAFFYTMWPRIRAVGSRAREEQGERF
jgi:heme/copper-type cytochrome/quinol oxidase subunit 1